VKCYASQSLRGVTYFILEDLKSSSPSSMFFVRLHHRRVSFRFLSLFEFSINDSLAFLLRFLVVLSHSSAIFKLLKMSARLIISLHFFTTILHALLKSQKVTYVFRIWDSSVGTAMGYGLEGRDSIPG
jgi:hypothetical protein